jgi:site-specific recombinase XerD
MDVLHLQAILGHSSLDMVQYYAQMGDDDLLQSHHLQFMALAYIDFLDRYYTTSGI